MAAAQRSAAILSQNEGKSGWKTLGSAVQGAPFEGQIERSGSAVAKFWPMRKAEWETCGNPRPARRAMSLAAPREVKPQSRRRAAVSSAQTSSDG